MAASGQGSPIVARSPLDLSLTDKQLDGSDTNVIVSKKRAAEETPSVNNVVSKRAKVETDLLLPDATQALLQGQKRQREVFFLHTFIARMTPRALARLTRVCRRARQCVAACLQTNGVQMFERWLPTMSIPDLEGMLAKFGGLAEDSVRATTARARWEFVNHNYTCTFNVLNFATDLNYGDIWHSYEIEWFPKTTTVRSLVDRWQNPVLEWWPRHEDKKIRPDPVALPLDQPISTFSRCDLARLLSHRFRQGPVDIYGRQATSMKEIIDVLDASDYPQDGYYSSPLRYVVPAENDPEPQIWGLRFTSPVVEKVLGASCAAGAKNSSPPDVLVVSDTDQPDGVRIRTLIGDFSMTIDDFMATGLDPNAYQVTPGCIEGMARHDTS